MQITKTTTPKPKPQPPLGFGKYFTDHMFLMDGSLHDGWTNPRIVPYAPLLLDPAAMVLHYGQEVFEGLKAYSTAGGLRLFRPQDNIRRMSDSCVRLGIPPIDEALFLDALKTLIQIDRDWVPADPGASLYIRPAIIAVDPFLGVRASETYLFMVILSPVGSYYAGGIQPTEIWVEDEDVRAVSGGLGEVKAGANYAATIRAQTRAAQKGFSQVLWLDGREHKYIEEVGTSNAFFVIDQKVITPALGGSILPGITRRSCLQLLRDWSILVEERPIALDEVFTAHNAGTLQECFATGTAAVVSPVGVLQARDTRIEINNKQPGDLALKLYNTLTAIQNGTASDPHNWIVDVDA